MGGASEPARGRSILRGEEDAQQANFLELFFDLVLVFALVEVVSRIVPDLLSDNARQQWLSLPYTPATAGFSCSGRCCRRTRTSRRSTPAWPSGPASPG